MRLLLFILPFLAIAPARSGPVSPNQRYRLEYPDSPDPCVNFIDAETGEIIGSSIPSGYAEREYLETIWSPDSQYLAVVSRGTKTTADIGIFRFSGSTVEELRLPDYRLNLLGWRKQVKGGRFHWVERLRWEQAPNTLHRLVFHSRGQWNDSPGDPAIDPLQWYHVDVAFSVDHLRAILTSITETPPPNDE